MKDTWWAANRRLVFNEVRTAAYAYRKDFEVYEDFEQLVITRARTLIEGWAGDEYTEEELEYHAESLGGDIAKWTWDRIDGNRPAKVKIFSSQIEPLRSALARLRTLDLPDDETAALDALEEQLPPRTPPLTL